MSVDLDCMGYPLKPVMDLFTKDEIRAAKRLARPRYGWDVVGTDPRVVGWRFLRDAKICLSGKDLGEDCPVKG